MTTVNDMTATAAASAAPQAPSSSLMDLLFDAFYMVSLLKNGYAPQDAESFRERIRSFLINFERGTMRLGTRPEDVSTCKFAFCALLDEMILGSQLKVRDMWERRPLQLEYFGNQLGGEKFYDDLESLRRQGVQKIQVLEVFHMCLLMGFKGKYILEGSEKLSYLTARLGDEIAHLKGKKAGFAPHWAAPDRIAHTLRSEVPIWVLGSVFALVGLLGFIGIKWALTSQTNRDLSAYSNVVQLAPEVAHITITLP
jgi:type VI secretion system protein ImpK